MNLEFIRLLESLANGVVIADSAGTIVFSNRFLEEMFGYEKGQLLGLSVDALLASDRRSVHASHRAHYNLHPETRLMGAGRDLQARRRNGSVFPVEVGLSPMETSEGLRIVAIVTDISKRKHAEQRSTLQRDVALLLSDADSLEAVALQLLQTIAVTLGWRVAALWLFDTDDRLMRVAAFWQAPEIDARELEKASRVAAVRKGEGLTGHVWEHAKPMWIESLESSPIFTWRSEAEAADLHSALALPILASGQMLGVIVFFSRDVRPPDDALTEITAAVASQIAQLMERKKSERALGLLQQQYLQAQKMEAIGRLAGGIAHDFNNLLTIIAVSTDTLLDQSADNEPLKQTADEIARATDQGASLVRQLMAFSRTQPRTTQAVDINEVIRKSDRMLGILAGEDIRLALALPEEEYLVSIEPSRLEQILMNLVANSRDAMPDGGVIRIESAIAHIDQAEAMPVGLKPQRHVTLRVSDNGKGIPAEIQPHIFEPFFSTKEEGHGTGLGLSSVYGILRQHEGAIVCESAVDEGTTFTIFLPLATPSRAAADEAGKSGKLRSGSESVLLVEDQPSLRASVRRILEQAGYRVVAAGDGAEALSLAEQNQYDFDLLVTDIALPQMRGTEIASRLLEVRPELRVLYMSGYNEEKIPSKPGTSFIPKPFRRENLIRKIREVLDAKV